jgi:hypothetical protein
VSTQIISLKDRIDLREFPVARNFKVPVMKAVEQVLGKSN